MEVIKTESKNGYVSSVQIKVENDFIKGFRASSDGMEEYERHQEFTAEGYYTIANAGGYEVELNKDGSCARLKDAYGNENPQITDWLEIENLQNPDMDFETIPTIDPKGYHIPLNLVISF